MDSIKDVDRSSVKVSEFDEHLRKAGGYFGRNVVEITIKMKTIVRKPLMIKITILNTNILHTGVWFQSFLFKITRLQLCHRLVS